MPSIPTPSNSKEGRFAGAFSSVATGLGLRKKPAESKPIQKPGGYKMEGAKIIVRTSLFPNNHISSNSSPSLTNQTVPTSKSIPSTKKRSHSKSKITTKALKKPKSTLLKEGGGSTKKLKLSHSSSKHHKEISSSSGQKLVKNRKVVVKKKPSTHSRSSSATLTSSKPKLKTGASSGSLKRKIKLKKKRALTYVSTTANAPSSTSEADDQTKNTENGVIVQKLPGNVASISVVHNSDKDTRIFTRAPLEEALIEALRTENKLDDTHRVRGGGVNSNKLKFRSSIPQRSVYNQPCRIVGTENIPDVPFYTPTAACPLVDNDWYNNINFNNSVDIDLRALSSTLPKLKTNSDRKNDNAGTAPPHKKNDDNSGSVNNSSTGTGSKETPMGSSQRTSPQASKDDEDPNKKKKDSADKRDDKNDRASSSSSRKRVTFSCVDTPFIINNTDIEINNRKKNVSFYLEPWQRVNQYSED